MKIKHLVKFFLIGLFFSCITKRNKPEKGELVVSDRYMANTVNIGDTLEYEASDSLSRGDMIVFDFPRSNTKACLRIVGFPGDIIEVIKGQLLINSRSYELAENSALIYTVYARDRAKFQLLKNYEYKDYSDSFAIIRVTKEQFQEIRKRKIVDSIYNLGASISYFYPGIVSTSTSKYHNHYYFGPIVVPKIGDTVLEADKMLLEAFSEFNKEYKIVKSKNYFCIGDSFSDALDSRIIGVIPDESILGKVVKIRKRKL